MNKKGQALVEFILVLPLFILMMVAFLDLARINTVKMSLENDLEDYISENKDISNIIVTEEQDSKTFKIEEDLDIYSPVLTPFLGNVYKVEVKRTIYDK